MKKLNTLDLKGRLYDYKLEAEESEKGSRIKGEIKIEISPDGIVTALRFFCNERTSKNEPNKTYKMLDSILAGNHKTVLDSLSERAEDGEDAKAKADDVYWLGVTGSIDVSYFVGRDGDIVRSQKSRGTFLNENSKREYSNKWKVDCIITRVAEIEADAEKQIERHAKVFGFLVDDYRECLKEIVLQAHDLKAIEYLLGNIDASIEAPHFVPIWGEIKKTTRLVVNKSAFGEDETVAYDDFTWNITGMSPEPYDISDEKILGLSTYEEFQAGLADLKEKELNKEAESAPALAF